MTPKQIEKEVQRQAVLFDERCAAGATGDGSMKFEAFAGLWFTEYALPKLRPRTIELYHRQELRTYAAIGHIRLDKLTARHIQDFINDPLDRTKTPAENYRLGQSGPIILLCPLS